VRQKTRTLDASVARHAEFGYTTHKIFRVEFNLLIPLRPLNETFKFGNELQSLEVRSFYKCENDAKCAYSRLSFVNPPKKSAGGTQESTETLCEEL
jgi:hypothetical protein